MKKMLMIVAAVMAVGAVSVVAGAQLKAERADEVKPAMELRVRDGLVQDELILRAAEVNGPAVERAALPFAPPAYDD